MAATRVQELGRFPCSAHILVAYEMVVWQYNSDLYILSCVQQPSRVWLAIVNLSSCPPAKVRIACNVAMEMHNIEEKQAIFQGEAI